MWGVGCVLKAGRGGSRDASMSDNQSHVDGKKYGNEMKVQHLRPSHQISSGKQTYKHISVKACGCSSVESVDAAPIGKLTTRQNRLDPTDTENVYLFLWIAHL